MHLDLNCERVPALAAAAVLHEFADRAADCSGGSLAISHFDLEHLCLHPLLREPLHRALHACDSLKLSQCVLCQGDAACATITPGLRFLSLELRDVVWGDADLIQGRERGIFSWQLLQAGLVHPALTSLRLSGDTTRMAGLPGLMMRTVTECRAETPSVDTGGDQGEADPEQGEADPEPPLAVLEMPGGGVNIGRLHGLLGGAEVGLRSLCIVPDSCADWSMPAAIELSSELTALTELRLLPLKPAPGAPPRHVEDFVVSSGT
ncbi:MAG: hypothetical protein HC937_00260 [Aquincola sp.]|nr:hypothetical protein [Aquincola sp.]